MIIRRNTKAYKTIVEIVSICETRSDRDKLIRLYITKAGHTIQDRLPVEGIEGDTDVFYDLNYAAVLANLQSTGRQLQQSDEVPGIYFFHAGNSQTWDENPFEFDERVAKEFATLPDPPVTRKREKPVKVEALPKSKSSTAKSSPREAPKKKEAAVKHKSIEKSEPAPRQPRYKLAHPIRFTDLDRVVIRQPRFTKEDVLDYYYKISDHILPYLKNRAQLVRLYNERGIAKDYVHMQALQDEAHIELPSWIRTVTGKHQHELLLCQDKEDLLFYIENGAIDMYPAHAKAKSEAPDYAVIGISATEEVFSKVVDVALVAYEILTGLQLPSLVKTDGLSGLHIYIPLDAKSTFESAGAMAVCIGKLIRLKNPNVVALVSSDDPTYGKVVIDDQLNEEGKTVIAPYSLLPENATVATPLLWEEVTQGLRPDQFTHENMLKRLKETGDLFEPLFKKKVNARTVAGDLDKHYGFLV
jgi:bifunctional non-homologous end joining protein LigD